MDLCDPKDLIVSLKNDRMVLRKRISERESKLREAQQVKTLSKTVSLNLLQAGRFITLLLLDSRAMYSTSVP